MPLLLDDHPFIAAAGDDDDRLAIRPGRTEQGQRRIGDLVNGAVLQAERIVPMDIVLVKRHRLAARRPVRPERDDRIGVAIEIDEKRPLR